MKKLLNSLFVLSEDVYLTLVNENIVVLREGDTVGRFPLHTLESILCFSYKGASPALMGACVERGILLSMFTPRGKYLCSATGEMQGNVLLRREQFRQADINSKRCDISRNFLFGKIWNSKVVLDRAVRDHPQRVDVNRLTSVSGALKNALMQLSEVHDVDSMRGLEGNAARQYFDCFDQLVLHHVDDFAFKGRSRRPPLDRINAVLSFVYTLLAHDCRAALQGVGLDPYVGFLHTDRSGRISLALDLMEELRPILADRFVLTLINTKVLHPRQFDIKENGAVYLDESGRKTVLASWQDRKRERIMHPFLKEKIEWGLVPHVQALLFARSLRGDLDGYPPFLWR